MKAIKMLISLLLTINLFGCTITSGPSCPRINSYFPADSIFFKQRVIGRLDVDPGAHLALSCCDLYGDCVWVDAYSDCPFPFDVFYCEWGISNADGTVDCFD